MMSNNTSGKPKLGLPAGSIEDGNSLRVRFHFPQLGLGIGVIVVPDVAEE